MKKLIVIALIGLSVTIARAEERKQTVQNLGIGSGALAGAIVGGPVGAIVGAAIGGHYTDNLQRSAKVPGLESDVNVMRKELGNSKDRVARLDRSLFETRNELDKLNTEMADLLLERAAFEGLQMEVLYHTGESELDQQATGRLNRLGELLKKLPDMTVRLDGYADPRGDESYNDSLSRKRAEAVRDTLIAAGVDGNRIAVHAHGESGSVSSATDLDAYALDRKVRLRLFGTTEGAKVALED